MNPQQKPTKFRLLKYLRNTSNIVSFVSFLILMAMLIFFPQRSGKLIITLVATVLISAILSLPLNVFAITFDKEAEENRIKKERQDKKDSHWANDEEE